MLNRIVLFGALAALVLAIGTSLHAQVTLPYSENFDTWVNDISNPVPLPAPWLNVTTDGSQDWYIDSAGTSSSGTGPAIDQSTASATGKYLYVEDSNAQSTGDVVLQSPSINLTGATNPIVTFWIHANDANGVGASNNILHFDVVNVTTSTTTTDVISPVGHIPDSSLTVWTPFSISLTAFIGNTVIIQFRVDDVGNSFTHDIAIDSFEAFDLADDVSPISLDAPVSSASLGAAESITVTIENFGINAATNFSVSYQINGGTIFTETFTGTIAAGNTAQFTFTTTADFSTPGLYDVDILTALTGDDRTSNDSLSKTIFKPASAISSFPYLEDFEAGAGGWATTGTSSWALGTPAKPVINSAFSGTNAWVTGLTAAYGNSEAGSVVAPVFDFSGFGSDPFVSVHVWWESEFSWDGMNLQSSIDGGTTWQTVGAVGDPNNWYTDTTIAGLAFSGSQSGWTGRTSTANGSNGWVRALHQLTGLGGEGAVMLRMAWGSDTSVTDPNGVAFDYFAIADSLHEMDVLRATTAIANGGTYNTNIPLAGANLTFTIENNGGLELFLPGATPVVATPGTNVATLNVIAQPTSSVNGNSSTTFTIDVVPVAGGAYDFTISIANDDVDESPYDFTVSGTAITNAPPTLALAAGSTFAAGSDFDLAVDPGTTLSQADLEADDVTPDNIDITVTFTGGPMGATPPTGITAPSSATGATPPSTLSWTGTVDANDDPGTYSWSVTVDDGVTNVGYVVNLIINDLDPTHQPATGITGDGLTAGTAYTAQVQIGAAGSVDIADCDDANLGQSVTIFSDTQTAAPSALVWNFTMVGTNPATLSVTPAAAPALADVGDFDYTVVVEDDNGNQATIFVTITVSGTAPTITSAAAPTTAADGVAFSHQFTATGNPNPTFAVTTGTLPAWATLTPAGLLSGTAALGQDINVTVSAQNGIAPDDTEVVTVTVMAGVAPTITSAAPPTTATVGTLYTFTFTASGTPAPTLSAAGLPGWLTFTPATGVLSGTPAAGDVGTAGPITITATNGVTPDDTEVFSIVVSSGGGGGDGGGDGGGGKDGGCSTDNSSYGWLALVGLLSLLAVVFRTAGARRES